jgi:hypothetical protein
MLFFYVSIKVGGKADLCFDLFFGITIVVVGYESYRHAALIPAGELEGVSVVVQFVLILVAHPVPTLPFRRVVEMGQSQIDFSHFSQMRRQQDITGMPGPFVHIQTGIIAVEAGSPIFPKTDSMKSRLEQSFPELTKSTSALFSSSTPGTLGETKGLIIRETKVFAFSADSWKGQELQILGRIVASR